MSVIRPEDFEKYPRYTITHIAAVNWKIDHIALFQYVTFPVLKKDPLIGVKRTDVKLPESLNGSILQIKYKDLYKQVHVRGYGVDDVASVGCFSNSSTVLMYMDKIIVLKVPSQGKIQITGCKTEDQVYKVVHAIWNHIQHIKKDHPEVSSIPFGEVPKVIYQTAMNNINMYLGFNINKRKVHEFLYKDTEFHIIPNDSRYAGICGKLEVEGIKSLLNVRHRFINGRWYASKSTWTDYLCMLSPKDRAKEEKAERYHTFLIFHSGKVIMSSPRYELMPNVFYYFVDIMLKNRTRIEDCTIEIVANKKKSK